MCWSKIKENRFLKFLGSVKLALVLFWLIIVVSFTGAVLPEGLRGYVFSAPWFVALLAVFAANILVCVFYRISFSRNKAGSNLVHLSVLLILLGSLFSYLLGVRGALELETGQSQDKIDLGYRSHDLGFRVYLEDFSLDWYNSFPGKYEIRVFVADKNIQGSYKLDAGQEQQIGGYSFSVADYFPDFGMDANMKAFNRSREANNPAVLLRIISPGQTEDRWIFANHPGMGMSRDENIKFAFDFMPMVKEYRSRLRIVDPSRNKTINALVKVNSPFSYRGYTFYQSGYDQDNLKYTSLEVVRDPGVGFVFTGFLLLNAGLIIILYPKLRRASPIPGAEEVKAKGKGGQV